VDSTTSLLSVAFGPVSREYFAVVFSFVVEIDVLDLNTVYF
jgi:hypothetical protein